MNQHLPIRWTRFETSMIRAALKQIQAGHSVYSQVLRLKQGPLSHRTWESIRGKLNTMRAHLHPEDHSLVG